MQSLAPLCEYCAKVPFGDLEVESNPKVVDSWSLGSGTRIKNCDCPFCQVVVRVAQTHYQTDTFRRPTPLSQQSEVVIRRYWTSGPGGRLAFHLGAGGGECWICIAAPTARPTQSHKHKFFYPTVGAEFDVGRLKNWIAACSQWHSHHRCGVGAGSFHDCFPGLNILRFVDVKLLAVAELQSVPKYIALSYVWGETSSVRLTTTSRASFMVPGYIEKAWDSIPRTIKDAIELTRSLGMRYLWVDALCLMQNDPDDVSRGVDIMDEIYERSWLTIIAASGHDADAGLPGIAEGSRCSTTAIPVTKDLSVGLHVPLDQLLKRSVYESRAWTFQEQLLARRAVYFTGGCVFYRCREDVYSEQCEDHLPRGGEQIYIHNLGDFTASLLPVAAPLDEPLRDFANLLIYYSLRGLSFQSDVLRALAGITRRVSQKAKCQFLQGIPTAAFDVFILFECNAKGILRRRHGFPSYSWVGWKGGLAVRDGAQVFYNLNRWLEEYTWIIWYVTSPSGTLKRVWDPEANKQFPLGDMSYPGYRKRNPFQAPLDVSIDSTRTFPTQRVDGDTIHIAGYPLLQFWTVSARFRMQLEATSAATGEARILTTHGTFAGYIMLDGLEETDMFSSQVSFEFILLSRTMQRNPWRKTQDPEAGYYVMLLEWKGPIAERRGLGVLDISELANCLPPGPQWKEIVLG
ncbi:heterokaryon incompatibility protein-domain-containing protein [Podospora aff. communis PSN243]|uniref:Heterokaryon incompatibility protein-domain-containing protein n=1 Tax=Podospora aff. communis PSN243 TaxID=3040156 RepID=A0AAV9GBQ1_9PEZI|nr:heterokaryon incompatibility protein-domain-containing protein [Podospora aff. communis PSN243]